ncbi:MAG TPA: hypothetical protein PL182_02310 [Pseudobdellovibrionaceae bacterium]|nr:hypothetical protein [Pseudobdellovibrionaceae bacterium]
MKALFCALALTAAATTAFANDNFCRAPVLKQARAKLLKTQALDSLAVESVTMGETFHTFTLKAFSKSKSGKKVSELFDAKIDSDCKILELEAQPDSQREE